VLTPFTPLSRPSRRPLDARIGASATACVVAAKFCNLFRNGIPIRALHGMFVCFWEAAIVNESATMIYRIRS
jgi:hypothetical protein